MTRMCGHPELVMAGRPKPPPTEIRLYCDCGENWGCPTCGFGAGSHPCRCSREREENRRRQLTLEVGV